MKIETSTTTQGKLQLGRLDLVRLVADDLEPMIEVPDDARVYITLADGTRQSIDSKQPLIITWEDDGVTHAEGDTQ